MNAYTAFTLQNVQFPKYLFGKCFPSSAHYVSDSHALVNQVLKGCVNAQTALPSSEDYRTAVFKHFTQSAHTSCTQHALYSSHLYVFFFTFLYPRLLE